MLWLAEGPSLPQAPSSRQGSQETEELRHAKTRDIAEQIIVRRLHLLQLAGVRVDAANFGDVAIRADSSLDGSSLDHLVGAFRADPLMSAHTSHIGGVRPSLP
jgi:hypothetical protein